MKQEGNFWHSIVNGIIKRWSKMAEIMIKETISGSKMWIDFDSEGSTSSL